MYPPPPGDDLRLSNTTGILQKKDVVSSCHQSLIPFLSGAPPPKKNPESAPEHVQLNEIISILSAQFSVLWARERNLAFYQDSVKSCLKGSNVGMR